MTGTGKNPGAALASLIDALVDDVLDASDQDILAEFAEDGGEVAKSASEMRAQFEKALLTLSKRRMKAAQERLAASRKDTRAAAAPTDIAEARLRLRRILESNSARDGITMAARNESELSDADVHGMLEDLRELGGAPSDNEEESKP